MRGERGPGGFERRGSADVQRAVCQRDGLQLGHLADVNQLAQITELLGHPQTHVGAAGQHTRLRPGQAQRGEGLQRSRCVEAAGGVQRLVGLHRTQGGKHGRGVQPHLRRKREHALACVQDGPVAGATAQVARQVVGKLLARGRGAGRQVALVAGPQRHHETGGAEAALRAVAVDQRTLHRVQFVTPPRVRRPNLLQVFDREQRLAVQRGQKLDAGVHRLQRKPARTGLAGFADHHRAGTTVAFVAAFLGAGAALVLAQPVEHRACARRVVDLDDFAAVEEAQGTRVHCGSDPATEFPER